MFCKTYTVVTITFLQLCVYQTYNNVNYWIDTAWPRKISISHWVKEPMVHYSIHVEVLVVVVWLKMVVVVLVVQSMRDVTQCRPAAWLPGWLWRHEVSTRLLWPCCWNHLFGITFTWRVSCLVGHAHCAYCTILVLSFHIVNAITSTGLFQMSGVGI